MNQKSKNFFKYEFIEKEIESYINYPYNKTAFAYDNEAIYFIDKLHLSLEKISKIDNTFKSGFEVNNISYKYGEVIEVDEFISITKSSLRNKAYNHCYHIEVSGFTNGFLCREGHRFSRY